MFVETITLSLLLSVSAVFPFDAFMGGCKIPDRRDLHNVDYENESDWNRTYAPNGYLLRFDCPPGYTIRGNKAILCLQGRWTSEFPVCVEKYCGSPPEIENSKRFIRKKGRLNPTVGSTVKYRCNRGFRLANESVSTLDCVMRESEVYWGGIMPECVVKEPCPDPEVSSDGTRGGKCCLVGNSLKFACNDGYEMIGAAEIECLESLAWSAPRPRCRPLNETHCPDPPEIPHGTITGYKKGDFYVLDDEAMVKCDTGFSPKNGSTFLFCEEEGEWDSEFAQCEEKFCEAPPDLGNGSISVLKETNSTLFRFGFQVTYQCNPGFRLIGDSMRSCANHGWTGKTPYCEVIRCYDPGHPENGKRFGEDFEVGSKVVFSCYSGYYVIGSAERYCLPNGQWSGELAKCDTKSNYCPDPGVPINGWKSGNRYVQGEVIKFGCHPGFFIVGSEERECQKDQTWTGVEPRCKGPHDFDIIANVAEKLIEVSDREKLHQKYGLNVSSEEDEEEAKRSRTLDLNYKGRIILYFLFDSSGSIGDDHFRTSIEFAKALVRKIGISLNGARAGAMTFSSDANLEFLPMRYENTDDVLNALDRIQKSVGGTATRKALDMVLTNMLPLAQEHFGRVNVKSIIFLLTDGKANMAGDPESQAKELKAEGVEIYCIGVTGDINQGSLHKIASLPIDEHVFILQNYESMSWLVQVITNGTVDYSQCGLGLKRDPVAIPREKRDDRGRVIGGRVAAQPWPWMAALYINKKLQCGGSIISRNWILTAAHCLTEDRKVKSVNSVIVKLGLTDVKNTTYLQEFESERFLIHENFDPITLDYDIALIKLQAPINYNVYVRPICLPDKDLPPESTLYRPRENAYATGWGSDIKQKPGEKLAAKTLNELKELALPIRTEETCQGSIRDEKAIFTHRMFCAGDGLGTRDTCKGDSGGPFMQSQMSKEKNVYWVQVGIVSWGEGCGMMHSYSFYTHVSRLRDWISNRAGI